MPKMTRNMLVIVYLIVFDNCYIIRVNLSEKTGKNCQKNREKRQEKRQKKLEKLPKKPGKLTIKNRGIG